MLKMTSQNKSVVCSFSELFNLNVRLNDDELVIDKVIIPAIQRDYAQGRNTPEIIKIRTRFLDSIKNGLINGPLYLDFIYGNIDKKHDKKEGDLHVLTPLDGQQRLTTLFLLHWYAAKKEIPEEEKERYSFLKRFSYEIRPSSKSFCNKLIEFNPSFEIGHDSLSKQIIDQSWFPLSWKSDPTIKSMLTMIDDIDDKFHDVAHVWELLVKKKKICFYVLDVKSMGLSDEVYLKMNSRGKPLTTFEHFKAEFEKEIKRIDENISRDIETKIDLTWTDFLWKYRKEKGDNLVDSLFLNFFKFICDVICYKEGESTHYRSYDEFELINKYFTSSNKKVRDNIDLLINSFDCFANFANDLKTDLFGKFLSTSACSNKTRIWSDNIDLLEDCLFHYINPKTQRRDTSNFSFSKFILLYSFLLYTQNASSISEDEFRERIRIINNLTSSSLNEMVDSENRSSGNAMPSILKQTESIILCGHILNKDELPGVNFNKFQLEEETLKAQWRIANRNMVASLNKLEDHILLKGQISIIGLNDPSLFDKFSNLFECDRDLISRALLTFGDYSRVSGHDGWQKTLGSGGKSNDSWEFLFHNSSAARMDETRSVLTALLSSSQTFNDGILKQIIDNFLEHAEKDSCFDWRYYFIKYNAFRPNKFGKYWLEYAKPYEMRVLVTGSKLSENSYQPFLKDICESNSSLVFDRDSSGKRLITNNNFIYCEQNRYVLKDANDLELKELAIPQTNDVDAVDRIKFFFAHPLV